MTISTDELILPVWNDDVEEVRRLLNNDNVNINYKREDTGWTPLILAIKGNNPEIVEMLLNNNNLNINQEDHDGWPAYKHAVLLNKKFPNDPNRLRIIQLLERNPKLNRDLGKNNNGEFTFDRRGNMGGRKIRHLRKSKKLGESKKVRKSKKLGKSKKVRKSKKIN
jgi:ankyrin repeat protein